MSATASPSQRGPITVPAIPRRTLARPATVSGTTLFTGAQTSITIRPASVAAPASGTPAKPGGIEFLRIDLPGSSMIRAHVSRVAPEMRRTVLSTDPADPKAPSVQTVEHLLSALAGLGITDAIVEVEGPEIPLGDGSAQSFVEAIQRAGVLALPESVDEAAVRVPATPAIVRQPIVLEDKGSRIEAHPTDRPGLELEYRLEYPGQSPIPAQAARLFVPFDRPPESYVSEIAPARTFCLAHEAQAMRQMGLFKHLTPAQMLVIGDAGPIDNAYRFPDEPGRHKLLDMLGDLSLAGRPIQARIIGIRSGHAQNHAMARLLAAL